MPWCRKTGETSNDEDSMVRTGRSAQDPGLSAFPGRRLFAWACSPCSAASDRLPVGLLRSVRFGLRLGLRPTAAVTGFFTRIAIG